MQSSQPFLLVLNPGSSTLKHAFYRGSERIDSGSIEWLASMDDHAGSSMGPVDVDATVQQLVSVASEPLAAIAYRVVHGGMEFHAPTVVSADMLERLEKTIDLAPLHQPPAIATMRAGLNHLPSALHVACFDTSFHATLPETERRFAIPSIHDRNGIRRYGFHGLSYESIAARLNEYSTVAARGRTVVCHLGNGASLCGMVNGQSQFTTMGLTPLDGLIMGTRCGRIDVGVVFHWLRQGFNVDQIERILTKESGLLGLSEFTSDMRPIVEEADADPSSALALTMFCRSVAKEITSAATAIGGIDAIVFTAGIGENSHEVRARVVQDLRWMGARMHEDANLANASMLHSPDSTIEILRIETDEQGVLARHARELLSSRNGSSASNG
jgi:acetate kinase